MADRFIVSGAEMDAWVTYLRAQRLPLKVTSGSATRRSPSQNRLQRKWCLEVAEQLGDRSAEDVRGYSKLHFGVPILRAEDEPFFEAYDKHVRPLPYEQKLALMMDPIDFPVTRRMTSKQKTRYLDDMFAHWTREGCHLTLPEQ